MMKATSETLRFYNADPPRLVINNPVDIDKLPDNT